MAFDAGSVFTRLGFTVDERGLHEYEQQVVKARQIKDIETRLGGEFDPREFKRYEDQLDKVQRRVAKRDAFKASLGGDYNATAFRAYERDLQRAERESGRLTATTTRLRGGLKSLGGGLGFGAATAGATAAAFAIRAIATATIDFDKGMRNVNSIAQLSERDFQNLSKSVRELAGKTAQAPSTLAAGLYDLVSSGFDAKESMRILASSAKAATAGLTSTEVSTKAVASVLNAYHKPATDAAAVSDTLFQTVNLGVISFEQLAENIGDTLPFASQMGITLEELGASTSTMTKQGLSASETMTRIRNVITTLIKPGDALKEAFDKVGFSSAESLIKAKGFQGALEALVGTTDGSKEAVAQLFPNIRSLGGALALTGKNAKSAEQDLKGFSDTGGATDKALGEQAKSISYQWNKAKAQLSAAAIDFGIQVAPAFISGIRFLSKEIRGFSHWINESVATVKQWGDDILGVVTTVLLGFEKLADAGSHLPLIGGQFKGLADKIHGARESIDEFRGSLRPMTDEEKDAQAAVKKHSDRVDALKDKLKHLKRGTDDYRSTARELRREQGRLTKAFEDSDDASRKAGRGIGSLGKSAGNAAGAVFASAKVISENVKRLARSLGVKPIEFNAVGGGVGATIGAEFKAGGGWIGYRGEAGGDEIPALLGRGEAVLNRHQQAVIEGLLGDGFLDHLFATVQRPHFLAKGGRLGDLKSLLPRFAGGGRYSFSQLAALWQRAGGPAGAADLMAAIALAESGGDPGAHNPSGATGLWQILGNPFPGNAYNPLTNARMAVSKYRSQGLGAWEVYTNGAYRQFLHGDASAPGAGIGAMVAPHLAGLAIRGPAGGLRRIAQGAADRMQHMGQAFLDRNAGSGVGGSSTHGLIPQVLRAIAWARSHGWHGSVTSGFRTRAEQEVLYARYLAGGNIAAKPGTSNHEFGRAIDVTDTQGFLRAMASAPPNARLKWFGPGDSVHFSIDGHSRGGFARFASGGYGSRYRAPVSKPFRNWVGAGAPTPREWAQIVERPAHRQEHGIAGFDNAISNLEREYGLRDREFGQSDEDYVIEPTTDGDVPRLNDEAIEHRIGELNELRKIRARIKAKIEKYRERVVQLIATYRTAIKRLINAGRGASKARRKVYAGRIGTMRERVGELQGIATDLGYQSEDQRLNLVDIDQELTSLDPTHRGTLLGDVSPLGGTTTADTTASAPTAEQLAQGVAETLAAFSTERANLFASFGSNAVRAGSNPFMDATGMAAGVRYYGAAGSGSNPSVLDASGGGGGLGSGNTFINHFEAPPPDPHTWTRQQAFEVAAS